MLRYLIGYILGTLSGIFLVSGFITISEDPSNLAFYIIVWVWGLVIGLFWSHKHHIRKRDDYYNKIKGKPRWWT